MGNHTAGGAMGFLAGEVLKSRKPEDSALKLLDKICTKYKNCDAEFEAEDPDNPGRVHPNYENYTDPMPEAALGMLMVEAFAPNGLEDLPRYAAMLDGSGEEEEIACDAWWEEVYEPFKKRYDFY